MRRLLLAAALMLATTLPGCDPGALGLPGFERLRIREVPASEVQALVTSGQAEIIQLRDSEEHLAGIQGARRLTVDAPLPEDVASLDHWLIVVADDRELGLRLAARLVRGGAPQVAMAVGPRADFVALTGFRTAARGASPASEDDAGAAPGAAVGEDPKPEPPTRHPSD